MLRQMSETWNFKIGDYILHPKAPEPRWFKILKIDEEQQTYILGESCYIYNVDGASWITLQKVEEIKHLILFINQELNDEF